MEKEPMEWKQDQLVQQNDPWQGNRPIDYQIHWKKEKNWVSSFYVKFISLKVKRNWEQATGN